MPAAGIARRKKFVLIVTAVGSVVASVLLFLVANLSMLITRADWSWGAFRSFGAHDQLSYLAYTVNAMQGKFAAVEPFTETGSSNYPTGYYFGLGIIAHLFNLTSGEAWSIVGMFVQVCLVITVSVTCIIISGKAWTGILGVGPFLLGVMAVATGSPEFYRAMDSHAVLWGTFAVLFPLNGEAFGLCVGGIALLVLLLAAVRFRSNLWRIAVAITVSAAIGGIANVQTYSFLTAVYIVVYIAAAYGVITDKRRWGVIVSIALLPLLYLTGPIVAANESRIVALVFGLLPAIPGLVIIIVRSRGLVLAYGAIAALAASPSVIGTLIGLQNHDPFLVYRVASSKSLGVQLIPGVVGSLVLSVPLIFIILASIRRKRPLWLAYSVGAIAAWIVLSTNDLWGANQEPYRLWIDSFLLIAVTALPVLLLVIKEYLAPLSVVVDSELPLAKTSKFISPRDTLEKKDRQFAVFAIVIVGVLVLLSMQDFVKFYRVSHNTPMIALQGARPDAILRATGEMEGGLILSDPCIEPRVLKAITGKPVAFLNLGMAWPEEYQSVIAVNRARDNGDLSLRDAEGAGVQWVITDSACKFDWPTKYSKSLSFVSNTPYGSGSIDLWRIHYDN